MVSSCRGGRVEEEEEEEGEVERWKKNVGKGWDGDVEVVVRFFFLLDFSVWRVMCC